ncbi:MAG: stage III sporulation protein AE [Clostridiales bacterium]|jgi:stage III sporulation protein AE|nr:stage III sporulation protein AE [Eubacteriales bacterium]MDH7565239.1 stage III sporulation protein AE [Clostridiales bacterium]
MLNKRHIKVRIKFYILLLAVASAILWGLFFTADVFAAQAEEEAGIIEGQLNTNEVGKIKEQLEKLPQEDAKEIIPEFDPEKIIKETIKGNSIFDATGIINKALFYLLNEIYVNVHVLIKLIVLVVLCAVLKNLQTSFLSDSVGELAFYVCYVVLISILVVGFNTALNLCRDVIDGMVNFMHACIPPLLTLLMSGGSITTAGIFQPVLITIVEISASIIKTVFIPVIFISTILSIVNNISDKLQISKLAGFLKLISGWGVGLLLTVFVAVVSTQGSLGAVVDGVTGKTAKYAVSTFIPVVGKSLSDAAEAVAGCTVLIKNAAGVAIMAGIIIICLIPLLKILALILLYKLACAVVEPISEPRITNCINEMAASLTLLLGIAASVMFMFLIIVTVIISAGNSSAMIR